MIRFHPFSYEYYNFIFLYGCLKSHWVRIHVFFIPSSVDGHLSWPHLLAAVQSAAMKTWSPALPVVC